MVFRVRHLQWRRLAPLSRRWAGGPPSGPFLRSILSILLNHPSLLPKRDEHVRSSPDVRGPQLNDWVYR